MLNVEGVLNKKALVRDATDDNTIVVMTAIFVPRAAAENIGQPKTRWRQQEESNTDVKKYHVVS